MKTAPLVLLPLACAALFGATPAHAHDFWIRPSALRCEPATRLSIDLQVGERLHGEVVARNPEKIAALFALLPGGREEPILGVDGQVPAGYLRVAEPGLVIVGYRSRASTIELEAAKFEAYLRADGLERIVASRKSRGESEKAGRETYSRCAKSLVAVGAGERKGHDRRLGFPLELVPEQDPYALQPGDELGVVLLLRGEPLADVLVGCQREGAPDEEVRLRTDERGRMRARLGGAGFHLVRAVHMLPAPKDSAQDWESLWASLTFEIGGGAQRAGAK